MIKGFVAGCDGEQSRDGLTIRESEVAGEAASGVVVLMSGEAGKGSLRGMEGVSGVGVSIDVWTTHLLSDFVRSNSDVRDD